jgi:transcriptional regulator with XRE-family HTH domain
MIMTQFDENPVNAQEAGRALGYSASSISALKRSMGIKSRKFFLSDARKFLRNNPQWTTSQVYHRKSCQCRDCLKKRAEKILAQAAASVVPATSAKTAAATSEAVAPPAGLGKTQHRVSERAKGSLGAKLRFLRGKRRANEIADKTGLSRESVYRIERGDPVKLATVKELADALEATRAEKLDLLVAWAKQMLGNDAPDLVIKARSGEKPEHCSVFERQTAQVNSLLEGLNETQVEHLILALQSREILQCLSAMVRIAGGNPSTSKPAENKQAPFSSVIENIL